MCIKARTFVRNFFFQFMFFRHQNKNLFEMQKKSASKCIRFWMTKVHARLEAKIRSNVPLRNLEFADIEFHVAGKRHFLSQKLHLSHLQRIMVKKSLKIVNAHGTVNLHRARQFIASTFELYPRCKDSCVCVCSAFVLMIHRINKKLFNAYDVLPYVAVFAIIFNHMVAWFGDANFFSYFVSLAFVFICLNGILTVKQRKYVGGLKLLICIAEQQWKVLKIGSKSF